MRIPDHVNFSDYVQLVGELEAQEIHSAGHWRDKLHQFAEGPEIRGDMLPWSKTHNTFRLRPGELTLWGGINGHGKSLLTGQVAMWLATHCKVAIASLEMYPEETLYRMCLQAAGSGSRPSKQFIDQWVDFADRNILVYDQLDNVPTEKILGFIHYCAKELKCRHIFLDSLQKCGIRNDIDEEKDFINRLQWAAKHLHCHIHLIHHVRKPASQSGRYKPNKFDVKGSGALTDLVDNLVIVWADEKRRSMIQAQELGAAVDEQYLMDSSDCELIVEKQRHGRWHGFYRLWLHPSGQFTPDANNRPLPFGLTVNQEAA